MKHLIRRMLGGSPPNVEPESSVHEDSKPYLPPDGALEFSRALVEMPREEAARLRSEYEARLHDAMSDRDAVVKS